MVAVGLAAFQLAIFQARVRPLGVTIIGPWDGFSFPSPSVAALAVTLVGMVYALLPPGRPRSQGKWAVGAILLLLGLARMYLAVDNPSDLVAGVVLGVAVPVVAFRFFAPNEVFPVTYRRAKAAHLDVGGRRGQAIRTGRPGAARADGPGRPTGRPGGFGGVDPAAAAGGRQRHPARA